MGFKQVTDIEYVDVGPNPNAFHKTKKMVWENNEWVEKKFIRLSSPDKNGISSMELWCNEHYGAPKVHGAWFKVLNYIVMEEKVYVHWKLCE